jgi:Ni,Fe-hydrogenase I small subunit
VIHNNAKSNKLEDQVFWYKASDHPNFRCGAPQFWEYHSSNYDDSDGEEDNSFNASSNKKIKQRVNVKKRY